MARPSRFNDQLRDTILKLYREGKTDDEVASIVGVSVRTLFYWKGKHKGFLQTTRESKSVADDIVEASAFQSATGYYVNEVKVFTYKGEIITKTVPKYIPPNPLIQMFWLRARQPDTWGNPLVPPPSEPPLEIPVKSLTQEPKKSFVKFCLDAGYCEPFEKQVEMMNFVFDDVVVPRLLLGSRGYGKTDYITVLGAAYKVYCDPSYRILIITKSKERNTAILEEIQKAVEANGGTWGKKNSTVLRFKELVGKDPNVGSLTIRSKSIRGRHPDLIIMDDPVTEDDTSPATRKQAKKAYDELVKLTQNIAIIGQPAHKADLYQSLRPFLRQLLVPHGTLPALDHDLEAQRLAGVSEASIQASYFLNVVAENPSPFEKVKFMDQYRCNETAIAFLDPSFTGGDTSALSIATEYFGGLGVKGRTWKKAWNHCFDEILDECINSGVKRLCIETNSLGDEPVLKARAMLASLGISDIVVLGRTSLGNKHKRIANAGVCAEMLHIAKDSDKDYITQVLEYEYGAKVDDAPDSLASLLIWAGLVNNTRKG